MKLQLKKTMPWGGKSLPKGTIFVGAAAQYLWEHPLLKQRVSVIPESVLDSHHAASSPPISELAPELAKRAAAKQKPSAAVPAVVPVALAPVMPTAAAPAQVAPPKPAVPPAPAPAVAVAAPKTGV